MISINSQFWHEVGLVACNNFGDWSDANSDYSRNNAKNFVTAAIMQTFNDEAARLAESAEAKEIVEQMLES